jgi:hypothetical protein
MALSAAQVYQLSGEQLRLKCEELGLDPDGTVKVLRCRVADHVRSSRMDQPENHGVAQARVQNESVHVEVATNSPPVVPGTHGSSDIIPILAELLRGVTPLSSEKPEEILWLFGKLGEIHALGLVDDRTSLVQILPVVTGSLFKFIGNCLVEKLFGGE